MSTYGFGPAVARWGGFLSDAVLVPYAEHMLVPLPDGLAPAAVRAPPTTSQTPGAPLRRRSREEPGAPVLVVGGASSGSIGLYAAAIALALDAASVTYVDADDARRALAESLGAETLALADAPQRLGPYPVTVDSCADADGLALALRSTAPDGVCTSTAIYFGEQPALPLLEMYTKCITFKTGRAHAREAMPHVLALAASGGCSPSA